MNPIRIINIDQEVVWNDIVKSFKKHDVYYLLEYVKAFAIHGDGVPELIYFDNDNLKAMNVVMKRDIAEDELFRNKIDKNTYYDYATPYGYGGFLFEGDYSNKDIEELNTAYMELCLKKNVISEFVRFHPILENYKYNETLYDVYELGNTVTLHLNSKEEIWNKMNKKNRNVIRKAIKSGLKVYWGRDEDLFIKFKELYDQTMDKDHADDYYYFKENFYSSICEDLKDHALLFYAKLNDKICAMSIILYGNKSIHYHLSASDKNFLQYAPTNLLLYEVACWGGENGYDTLHLGGGLGSKQDNLYKFKKAFTKDEDTIFAIGKKIFDEQRYHILYEKITNKISTKENGYFPEYRRKE